MCPLMGQPVDGPILRDIWAAGIELLKKNVYEMGSIGKLRGSQRT